MKFHLSSHHHNDRHRTETKYIRLDTSQCKACWACMAVCPQHVFGKVDLYFHRHVRIDQVQQCKGCLRCVKACEHQAILSMEKTYDNASR